MDVNIERLNSSLQISLSGELDHHAAKDVVRKLNSLTESAVPAKCVLDMGGVGFMDSSGIAVVLGLYRRLGEVDSKVTVKNVPVQAMKVFNAAGIDRLVTFE
ncbi:MAG: STAS domain-containing protein [Oscillospiraceae bacterium]|jgi:stage II sporulation protein AA (anti-sigma F factor antagonist)|nr:STAS domain-containing protein [Oscillospiraceae bacterium]